MPSKTGGAMDVRASFAGFIAQIPLTAEGAMAGDRVDATVDVPEAASDRLHALVAALRPAHPVSLHLDAHGPMAAIAVALDARSGPAKVRARATVSVPTAATPPAQGAAPLPGGAAANTQGPTSPAPGAAPAATALAASAHVDLEDVDLHALAPGAPASDLGAAVDISAHEEQGLWSGKYALAVAHGAIAEQEVPDVALRGTFAQTAAGTRADLATNTFELPPNIGGGRATFEAKGLMGHGEAAPLDAEARLVLEKLDRSGLRLDTAALDATARGPASDPRVQARLDATHFHAAGYAFRSVAATLDGRLSRSDVTLAMTGEGATSSVHARATLDRTAGLRVESPEVDVWRDEQAVHAHVDRVVSAGPDLDVEGLVLTGAGAPARATIHMRPGTLTVQGDSNGVDLGTLGSVLGLEKTLRRGRVGYVVDLAARPRSISGSAVFDLSDACFWHIDGLTGHFDTQMKGRDVKATAHLRAAGVGSLDADPVRVTLGGDAPLEEASWRRAWGELTVRSQIDLARALALLPPNTVPVGGLAGQLSLDGHVTRAPGSDALPDVTVALRTQGLRTETRSAPDAVAKIHTVVVATPARTAAGIDVALDVAADGPHGTAKIGARLVDARGTVLSLDASSDAVPYAQLAGAGAALVRQAMRVPFTATVAMPSRRLEQMPDALRFDGASGDAQFTMSVQGPALTPHVTLQGQARGVEINSRSGTPLDADLRATYDGAAGDLSVKVRGGDHEVLDAAAHLNARVEAFLGDAAPAWDAEAHAKLDAFPLRAVPNLTDRGVHGTASGSFELTGLHRDARAKMQLDVDNLAVRRQPFGKVHAQLDYDGHAARGALRVDQGSGSAEANADLGLRWGADVAPSLDPAAETRATLKAHALRIGFLAPFLQSSLDSLDGKLDADAHLDLAPKRKPDMSGTVALSDGVVGLIALGQELHAVKARLDLSPDGTLRLHDVSASATAGKLTAQGTAHLDGTALTQAKVDVDIAKKDAMPLDVEGSDLGSVYGKVAVQMTTSADRRAVDVAVDVPMLRVRLPEASTHTPQDLSGPPEHDHVGVYVTPDRFVTLPLDGHQVRQARGEDLPSGNTMTIGVTLGDISIARGTDIRVDLGGKLQAKLGAKTEVTGQITLHGGKLTVQGKTFEVESGLVTFTGDPTNPEIKVTAAWPAPDGTRVYADYVGPLKTGKVVLRSEPPRSQNEVVALLLFGTDEGSESTPYQTEGPDAATTAGTAVGGFAAGGLSKGLDKLTGLDITAKIDTTQANPRPEVEVQVARNISLELAVVLGTPPPGTNPDTTYATIDWRFHANWSLQATFGDLGSSIADVVWRRRY